MFEVLRVAQVSLWAAIVVLAGVRLRALHAEAVDGQTLARRLRGRARDVVERALRAAGPELQLLVPAVRAPAGEGDLVTSEVTLAAERAVLRGAAWVRILGLSASALGFVVVAHQISWLHADHGLLDLDPARVGRIASERSAVGLALAVAGSGSAVALSAMVRARARVALRGIAAFRDLLDRERPRWTDEAPRC